MPCFLLLWFSHGSSVAEWYAIVCGWYSLRNCGTLCRAAELVFLAGLVLLAERLLLVLGSSDCWAWIKMGKEEQFDFQGQSLYANGCYKSIISFGDSLADTGTLKQLANISNRVISFLMPPYGESLPDHSTGRCSNGRLVIDFLAESLGLPLIPPYVHDKGNENAMALKLTGKVQWVTTV
ncbi:SGNH hydrolase-type esterase domain-containing protein [Tanacetum coccineum]